MSGGLEVSLRHAFAGFSLDLAFEAGPGVTALFGPSGAGKSTVLAAVAGLMRPDAACIMAGGRCLVDTATGRFLPPHKRRVAYVFQDARLFPHMTVRQNLRYGMTTGTEADIAGLLGLAPLLERRPRALSGGEAQRVAIGRALLSAPEILLMDEPLAALDAARKAEILPYLAALRDRTQIPILYVSHALGEVAQLANHLVLIDAGRITAQGPAADLLADPAMTPHLGERGTGALLTGRIVAHHADGLSEVAVPGGTVLVPRRTEGLGQSLRLRIAGQDIILSRAAPEGLSALNVLRGTIAQIGTGPERAGATATSLAAGIPGADVSVQIDLGGAMLLARVTGRSVMALGLAPGQEVHAILKTVAVSARDIGGIGNI